MKKVTSYFIGISLVVLISSICVQQAFISSGGSLSLRRAKDKLPMADVSQGPSRGLAIEINNALGLEIFRNITSVYGKDILDVQQERFIRSHQQLEHPVIEKIYLQQELALDEIKGFIQPFLEYYLGVYHVEESMESFNSHLNTIANNIQNGIRNMQPAVVSEALVYFLQATTEEAITEDLMAELGFEEVEILKQRLAVIRAVSRSVGGDFEMRIAAGKKWAYNFENNTVTVPMQMLLADEENISVAKAIHEGGHREISRVIDKEFTFGTESHRLLYNGLEDPRVNNWEMQRYPGVKDHFMVPLYEEMWPLVSEGESYDDKNILPHVQFIYGLIYRWANGEESPSITNQRVLDALEETREYAQQIYGLMPSEGIVANSLQVQATAEEMDGIIKNNIWPVYERLIEESAKMIEQGLKDGTIQPMPSGLSGQPGALSPDELTEEARRIIEETSKELADKLAPQVSRSDLEEAKKHLWDKQHPQEEATGDTQPESALERFLRKQREAEKLKAEIQSTYNESLAPVAGMVDQLVGFLENTLYFDSRPRVQGYYDTGTKIDIDRLLQRIGEGSPERDVFMRRTQPIARSHKFSLVLDESGSMLGGNKAANAMQALVLFVETLQVLEIDNSIIGFSSGDPILHKDFGSSRLDPAQKNEVFREINVAMGGGATHDAEALEYAISNIAVQDGEERIIIILTDGEGNGSRASQMPQILAEAERMGIKVIGVGIGDGITHVEKVYTYYVQVPCIEDLPTQIARIIEREVLGR